MTDERSLERAARSWIEAGPTQAPDRAVEAAILRIESTPQERDLRIPWRSPKMSIPARAAAAAVIGVLAIGGTFLVINRSGQPSVAAPASPSPSVAVSPSPTPLAQMDYSTLPGRILVEHLGNALDLSERTATDASPDKRRLYFMNPADMTSTTVVEFLPGQPTTGKSAADVSSDGKKVVFQDWADQTRVYEANLDGTGFRTIPVECSCGLLYPDYDPTATKIVYVRIQGGQSWLEIRDLATNEVTKLVATVGSSADDVPEQPAWSPDGKTIAYSRLHWGGKNAPVIGTVRYGDVPPASGRISLVDVATGEGTEVPVPLGVLPGDVNWSPDGASLLFTSGPASTTGSDSGMPSGGSGGVRRINLDGSGLVNLPGWGGPQYLPDGVHVLVQDNVFEIMNGDGTGLRPVNMHGMDLSDVPQGFTYIGHWIQTP